MISEKKKIQMRDGISLHADIVENGSPVWLVMTHGLGEHSERHFYLHKLFSQYFNICIYDVRGHGKSEGKRGYVKSFKDFTNDLGEILEYLKSNYSMDRFLLMGHSMGALITASYMQNEVKDELYPEKVFLSSPPVAAKGPLGGLLHIAPVKFLQNLKQLPLTVPVSGLMDLSKLSHDPRVYESYVTDEFNVLKTHTKTIFELLAEARDVFSRPLRVKCDLYSAVGTADGLVEAKTVISYFNDVEKNAKFKVIEDGYHELHNEIEKYREPYLSFLKESLMDSIYV